MRSTKRQLCGVVVVALSASLTTVSCVSEANGTAGGNGPADLAFRDALGVPPPGWDGPVFELSDQYPTEDPGECPKDVCTWLALDVDFTTNFEAAPPSWDSGPWAEYIPIVSDRSG